LFQGSDLLKDVRFKSMEKNLFMAFWNSGLRKSFRIRKIAHSWMDVKLQGKRESISISVMREIFDQLRSAAPVPLYPKPMKEGGRVLARMEGNRHRDRLHLHY